MHIVQVYHAKVPVSHYGGMERVIESLLEGFIELGHQVTLIAFKGDYAIPGVNFLDLDRFGSIEEANRRYAELIPANADIVHFHLPYKLTNFPYPYVCTMHGNLDQKEDQSVLHENTIFLCSDHAKRHGKTKFVFNGLNPKHIPFSEISLINRHNFSFLGRASLKRKGLHLAKKIARQFREKLVIGGGHGFNWFGRYEFLGHVDNEQKFSMLKNSKAFLFPILWEEPFGLVMIEAMFTGTPVFALKRGAVCEVLEQAGGAEFNLVADNLEDLIQAISRYSYQVNPRQIRSYAEQHFTHLKMCEGYLKYYHDAMK